MRSPLSMTTQILTSDVHYSSGDLSFRGFVAEPHQSDADKPGVLVVPEWWGLNAYARHRAEQLARLGYVALAVDMYGDGITTHDATIAAALARDTRIGTVARERINCAFDVLRKRPGVDPKRIVAVGFCFGGSVALELARSGAEIRGAVCFHGSLATPMPARPETLKASILVLNGADDSFVSKNELQAFENEMRAAEADWQLLSLGGAVHSFSNAAADAAGIPGVAFHARSERRAWRAFEDFLLEMFS
ncbi:MAG: dienelactone hydrolase family protein [Vulcanimicrobiaceae bacterium]